MRKWLVILLVLALCGCTYPKPEQAFRDIDRSMHASQNGPETAESPTTTSQSEGTRPDSLQGYLTSSRPQFCNFSDGARMVEIWLWDGRYSAVLSERQKPSRQIVNDGIWEYNWQIGQNTGIKYKNSEVRGLTGEATKEGVESNKTRFVLKDIDEVARHSNGLNCKEVNFEESLLAPPRIMQFRVAKAKLVDAQS